MDDITLETVIELNNIAKTDFVRAHAMLDGINLILGTEYGWLARRVVKFADPHADTATKYANCTDMHALLYNLKKFGNDTN